MLRILLLVGGFAVWLAGVLIDAPLIDLLLIVLGALLMVAGLNVSPSIEEGEDDGRYRRPGSY